MIKGPLARLNDYCFHASPPNERGHKKKGQTAPLYQRRMNGGGGGGGRGGGMGQAVKWSLDSISRCQAAVQTSVSYNFSNTKIFVSILYA